MEAAKWTCYLPVHLKRSKMFSMWARQSSAVKGSFCSVNSFRPLFRKLLNNTLESMSRFWMTICVPICGACTGSGLFPNTYNNCLCTWVHSLSFLAICSCNLAWFSFALCCCSIIIWMSYWSWLSPDGPALWLLLPEGFPLAGSLRGGMVLQNHMLVQQNRLKKQYPQSHSMLTNESSNESSPRPYVSSSF